MATERTPRRRMLAWTIVYALNLVVPLWFGWEVTERGGRLGLGVAVAAGWAAGLFICYQSYRTAAAFVRGGTIVAVCQALPILQLGAGILAIVAWTKIAGHDSFAVGGLHSELSGFAVTLFTGSMLFLAAVVLGGGVDLLFRPHEVKGEGAADYAESFGTPGAGREQV